MKGLENKVECEWLAVSVVVVVVVVAVLAVLYGVGSLIGSWVDEMKTTTMIMMFLLL